MVPGKLFSALSGVQEKYPDIFRQYFNFWQPYFKVKKPWLHRGKVLFVYSFFLHAYRVHSTLQ
jgi:hypothetical protein